MGEAGQEERAALVGEWVAVEGEDEGREVFESEDVVGMHGGREALAEVEK